MQNKTLRFVGFVSLFLLTFVIGLLLTLPTTLMSRVVETQLEKALQGKYDISVETVRINGLIGARLNNFSITSTAPLEIGQRPHQPTTFQRIQLNVRPLSLLAGNPKISLRLEIQNGEIEVNYRPKDELKTRLRVAFENVDLREMTILRQYVGSLPLQGTLVGTIEFAVEDELKPQEFATRLATGDLDIGNIEIGINNMMIGPGALRGAALDEIGGFLPLPTANLGNFVTRITFENGQIRINQFECSGQDLVFGVDEGRIDLRQPFGQSRIQISFSFEPSEEFIEQAQLTSAFSRVPFLAAARTDNGYALAIAGTLDRPGNPQPLRRP